MPAKKSSSKTQIPTKQKAGGGCPEATCSAGWLPPKDAPQDGTQILGDFGYPWPQVTAWNSHDEKWATVCMMAQGMQNGTTDIWFETELEVGKQLKRWMHLPSTPNAIGHATGEKGTADE